GEQRDADAHDMLGEAERHRQRRVKQAEGSARKCCDRNAEPKIAAEIYGEPARKSADDHDALDAEVEDARPLADKFAHGGEDQRRGDADRSDPEGRGEEDFEGLDHRASPLWIGPYSFTPPSVLLSFCRRADISPTRGEIGSVNAGSPPAIGESHAAG